MICPNVLYSNIPRPPQPDNPTDEERSKMSYYALYRTCHTEDFHNITEALSPPKSITLLANPGEFKGKKVGIIGGGLAGMSSAFELRKLGFDITIFEASDKRIGGRVYTYYFDKDKKLYGELGPMRIPVNHETVWHYINLFKLNTRPFRQTDPNTFIYLHQTRVRNDAYGENVKKYIYPTYNLTPMERRTAWQELGYYAIEAPILKAPPSSRIEILKTKETYSKPLLYWDSLNTRQMFESRNLSQGAINLLSNLFPIGGEYLYNNYVDFVQEYFPVNFWFMYEIIDGLVNLPLAFHKSFLSSKPQEYYPGIPVQLLGKVKWKSGNTVKGIYRRENSYVTLSYQDNTSQEIRYEDFDYIICAVPFSVLRTMDIKPMFRSRKMQAIKEVNYGNALKSIFNCNKRFWEEQGIFGGGSYTDLPITTIWYPSDSVNSQTKTESELNYNEAENPNKAENPGVFLASYNFNLDSVRLGNITDKERFEIIKRDVEEVHGLSKFELDSIVTDSKTQVWSEDPLFRGAFCYFTPQQKKLFSWEMTLPEYDNRVFFAGEHVSPLHRWMQGALQSGMEAANALVSSHINDI
ncbi:FAD-dependent oxidoreductase [Ruminiclostridium herbifermentans]|uniref:FAD-dependent oxidoreductase n=1 Tax=Ruminiclostridium herbifermentans TaxID=2488810 RepID=A0A4U7JNA7_9FIRM|nr:NAD(P)/FAD-dependent oxidoreductase [Ruminiclostridium herbifermentans]QNU68562.1 FAD-dependent oxidoreductase [Ruminiclostridium herbifermentans]